MFLGDQQQNVIIRANQILGMNLVGDCNQKVERKNETVTGRFTRIVRTSFKQATKVGMSANSLRNLFNRIIIEATKICRKQSISGMDATKTNHCRVAETFIITN